MSGYYHEVTVTYQTKLTFDINFNPEMDKILKEDFDNIQYDNIEQCLWLHYKNDKLPMYRSVDKEEQYGHVVKLWKNSYDGQITSSITLPFDPNTD